MAAIGGGVPERSGLRTVGGGSGPREPRAQGLKAPRPMGSRKGVSEGEGPGWAGLGGSGPEIGEGVALLSSHPLRLSHSHFPNSPVLPGCQGNRSCQARSPRKPRARLSPRPITGRPPIRQRGVEGRRGNGGGKSPNRVPNPHPRAPTQAAPTTPQRGTQRPQDVHPHPGRSPGCGDPPTQNSPGPETPPAASPPAVLPTGPSPCPLPPPPPREPGDQVP